MQQLDEDPTPGTEAREPVMGLLHDHVPLSLLVDLAQPATFDSRAILEAEGEPDTPWWQPRP